MAYRKCIDCHKKCDRRANRCRKCYHKTLKGTGNPMFCKRTAKQYACKDCGKEINWSYKRCHSCACKYIWKTSLKMKNRRSYKGSLNPNYIDGLSNLPYPLEFNEDLKLEIRTRDEFECQNCDMTEEEHLTVWGIVLIVHHIDYNKQNYEKENLTSLCNQCNVRANYNRNYWEQFYKEKVNGFISKK